MKSNVVLTSILIVGLISLLIAVPLADAVDVGDKITIKGKKGTATCTDAKGESCGIGKARTKLLFIIDDVQKDSFSGIGKGKLQIKWDEKSLNTSSSSPEIHVRVGVDLFLDAGNNFRIEEGTWKAIGTSTNENGEIAKVKAEMINIKSNGHGKFTADLELSAVGWQNPLYPNNGRVVQFDGSQWTDSQGSTEPDPPK